MRERRDVDVIFDGSFEGFLCVLYAYYYEGIAPQTIQPAQQYQAALGAEEYAVVTDMERAVKVQNAIYTKISCGAGDLVARAFLAGEDDKYMTLFHFIVFGFKVGAAIDNHFQQDFVMRTTHLARRVGGEAHLLKGFCRFAETAQGIYYCSITPKHQVLHMLAHHFCDRMMNLSWVIHDKTHGQAALYNGHECVFVPVEASGMALPMSENESQIQDLWVAYFQAVAIEERRNRSCQRNLLPMHFRKNMTEFNKVQ